MIMNHDENDHDHVNDENDDLDDGVYHTNDESGVDNCANGDKGMIMMPAMSRLSFVLLFLLLLL